MPAPLSRTVLRLALLAGAAAGALALGACKKDKNDLLANLDVSGPSTEYAPAPNLPTGPAQVAYLRSPNDAYAWGERSYGLDRVFYDSPPDYAFDYGNVRPWVWQTQDRWATYADPYGDDYRYYYYRPDAVNPYYIRDDQYGYGFDDAGRLVGIFDLLGRLLPQSVLNSRTGVAGDYYRRAYDMRRASQRARSLPVEQTLWLARESVIASDYNTWLRAAQNEPWVQYRQATNGAIVRTFEGEARRRKGHPGFPAHAKGWGPPFLREDARQIAVLEPSRAVIPQIVMREDRLDRDRRREERREEKAFDRADKRQAKASQAEARRQVEIQQQAARQTEVAHEAADRGQGDRKPEGRKPQERAGADDPAHADRGHEGKSHAQASAQPQQQAHADAPDQGRKDKGDKDPGGKDKADHGKKAQEAVNDDKEKGGRGKKG